MREASIDGLTVAPAEGRTLERVLDLVHQLGDPALDRGAVGRLEAARSRTAWALRHRRRVALLRGDTLLACAVRHDLTGVINQRAVSICAVGGIAAHPTGVDAPYTRMLVEGVIEGARGEGCDVALLFVAGDDGASVPDGFEIVPTVASELRVTESTRRGAPMMLVRTGEQRDVPAIVALGDVFARRFAFRIDRDAALVEDRITRARLLAGVSPPGHRELRFVVAEEGTTAAAYAVVSVASGAWTIEECGDRDESGARVGAILQALIARDPREARARIRARLPPGFLPPQVAITGELPATSVVWIASLRPGIETPRFAASDVLSWDADVP
jgi:hypothetical protein